MSLLEMERKNEKKLLVLKIIEFDSGATNSHSLEQDISLWQSMCYKTSVRFNISLRDIFSKSGSLRVMEKSIESFLKHYLQDLGTL